MVEVQTSDFDAIRTDWGTVAQQFKRYLPSMAFSKRARGEISFRGHKSPMYLQVTRNHMETPYKVSTERGVTLSMWQCEGICAYAGISQSAYLTLLGLLGISQWSALKSNPLLEPEDLIHPAGAKCLFATQEGIENFALQLEDPSVCPGCIDFYHCRGADIEVIALREAIGTLQG